MILKDLQFQLSQLLLIVLLCRIAEMVCEFNYDESARYA
jgi:hypothetical protein